MKEINTNYWAAPVPITDLLTLANGDTLFYNFYVYIAAGPANFYYRLARSLIYSILDEDDYFDEDYQL